MKATATRGVQIPDCDGGTIEIEVAGIPENIVKYGSRHRSSQLAVEAMRVRNRG
ncbi:MAG TPA: hypothetical protein VNU19_01060 [Candidatus Acidoferrum sp.]|nr:hypothetical protein [Candidatus Acidoferrum sp.]